MGLGLAFCLKLVLASQNVPTTTIRILDKRQDLAPLFIPILITPNVRMP